MSNTELHEMLVIIGRTPEMFCRDTPMLLQALENAELIKKKLAELRESDNG